MPTSARSSGGIDSASRLQTLGVGRIGRTGFHRATHRSSPLASVGMTRPRASSSSPSFEISARNRGESPIASPGSSAPGRPSRNSTASAAPNVAVGTIHGCKRSGRLEAAPSSSARSRCGEACGPCSGGGKRHVQLACERTPRDRAAGTAATERLGQDPRSPRRMDGGAGAASPAACRAAGRRCGRLPSSHHADSRAVRDQMACRTITDRHVHASPGQRDERSADDRSSCMPRDSRDPNSCPAARPGPIAIAITEANRTRDPWQHSWQHPPCPVRPIRPENRTICAYQTPAAGSTQGDSG